MNESCALALFSPLNTLESAIGPLDSSETMTVVIQCRRCPRTPALVTAENVATLQLEPEGTCDTPVYAEYVLLQFTDFEAARDWFNRTKAMLVGYSYYFFNPAIEPNVPTVPAEPTT